MYNIENNFDADIGQLRQIASRFCPEELKSVARQVIPDEFDAINLKQLESDNWDNQHKEFRQEELLYNLYNHFGVYSLDNLFYYQINVILNQL